MRGNIFGVLAIAVLTALLPAMWQFNSPDSTGQDFIAALDVFVGPMLVMILLVACAALVVNWMHTDSF
jgi:hypothetical protein